MPIERTVFYESAPNRSPVLDAISGLEAGDEAAVLETIEAFAEEFPLVRTIVIKHLAGKLWEMKVRRVRVLYGVAADALLVVHVFVKKTQKTPRGDLDLGVKRLKQMVEARQS